MSTGPACILGGMAIRAIALACGILAVVTPAAHARGGSLDRTISAALETPGVTNNTSTAMVVEIPSGRVVYARNPDLSLQPASNEKLCVNYTALVVLGAGYRFPTELLGEGVRAGSTWRGSLVLKGVGGPSLTTDDLTR